MLRQEEQRPTPGNRCSESDWAENTVGWMTKRFRDSDATK